MCVREWGRKGDVQWLGFGNKDLQSFLPYAVIFLMSMQQAASTAQRYNRRNIRF